MADQLPVLQPFGSHEFHELHAVLDRHFQFFLIRRHIALCPAIDQAYIPFSRKPFSRPGHIHGRIAAAQHNDVFSDFNRGRILLDLLQKIQRVQAFALLQRTFLVFPCADGNNHVAVAFRLQFLNGFDLPSAHNFRAESLADSNILFDRLS